MKQIEQHINKLTDVAELNRIGRQYAYSGNYAVSMKAWLRAVKRTTFMAGDTSAPIVITSGIKERYDYGTEH